MLYTYSSNPSHTGLSSGIGHALYLLFKYFTYRFLSGLDNALYLPSNPSHTGLLSGVGHALYLLMLYTYFQILHIRDSCRGRPCFVLTLQILHIRDSCRGRPCFILTLQILHIQTPCYQLYLILVDVLRACNSVSC